MPTRDRCECLHCKELFVPRARNWWHQKFCSKPECRKASKAQSQRRWLSKPENRDHFRGSANVERVRQWRQRHPGYWKRPSKAPGTLQDVLPLQAADNAELAKTTSAAPLQDFVAVQDPLLLGLISHLVDSPLQEVVEQTTLRLIQKGRDLLDMRSMRKAKGNTYADEQTGRLRKVPPQFSWVDQRLVRQRYIERCDHASLALYLVLVTVADAEGLSYYSDASLERMLRLDHAGLSAARSRLSQAGLVVYQKPLYQVLALEPPTVVPPGPPSGQTRSLKEILAQMLEANEAKEGRHD